MNVIYDQYVNLKHVPYPKPDYLTFLSNLSSLPIYTPDQVYCPAWISFLDNIIEYLEKFFSRSKPLFPLDSLKVSSKDMFRIENESILDPSMYCSFCEKWFSNVSVHASHLSGKRHQRAVLSVNSSLLPQKDPIYCNTKWKRFWILQMIRELDQVVEETRNYIERKQSRTLHERQLDTLEQENQLNNDDEIDLEQIEGTQSDRLYNPLKLPLGWDGKPIPYWLYKLHGLGKEYSCEICGNYIYMGRKAYDRHSQEWRHSYGMKCLGIPNTKQFHEISQIKDAISLWKKVQTITKKENFRPDIMEEFEDSEGNVFNRKTFEDLHRQGLL